MQATGKVLCKLRKGPRKIEFSFFGSLPERAYNGSMQRLLRFLWASLCIGFRYLLVSITKQIFSIHY